MPHIAYAMGLLPDDQVALDGATNLFIEVENALNDQFGTDADHIDLEVEGDRLRLYIHSAIDARALLAQLEDFHLEAVDGAWEFSFDIVDIDWEVSFGD